MVGGQHRAPSVPVGSALKSARFWLKLSVVAVLPLALIGLGIYLLLAAGTETERLGAQLVLGVITLIWAVRRPPEGVRILGWSLASLVLVTVSQLAGNYAQHRGRATVHALILIDHGLFVAAVGCIGVATVIGARSCILWWRRRRLARP
jgi:hypothetical protein